MLSAKEVIEYVNERVSYKPGYRLQAFLPFEGEEIPHARPVVMLRLSMHTDDSRNPGYANKRLLSVTRSVWYELPNYDALNAELRDFFRYWECHEADEWFKVDGRMVHDPHA